MGQKWLGRRQRLKWEKPWHEYRRPRPILDMRMEEDGFHVIFYPVGNGEQTEEEYSDAQLKEKRDPIKERCTLCRRFPNDPRKKNMLGFLIYETIGLPRINWDALEHVKIDFHGELAPVQIKLADDWEIRKYAPCQ